VEKATVGEEQGEAGVEERHAELAEASLPQH